MMARLLSRTYKANQEEGDIRMTMNEVSWREYEVFFLLNVGAADLETGPEKGSQEGFDRGRVGALCTKRASWWYAVCAQ